VTVPSAIPLSEVTPAVPSVPGRESSLVSSAHTISYSILYDIVNPSDQDLFLIQRLKSKAEEASKPQLEDINKQLTELGYA